MRYGDVAGAHQKEEVVISGCRPLAPGERHSQRAPPRFIKPSRFVPNRVSSGDRRQRLELGLEFGDNDGFLDAYIVIHGQIAAELFEHLPGDELVEENQAFRNVQGAGFLPAPGMGTGRAGEAAA